MRRSRTPRTALRTPISRSTRRRKRGSTALIASRMSKIGGRSCGRRLGRVLWHSSGESRNVRFAFV